MKRGSLGNGLSGSIRLGPGNGAGRVAPATLKVSDL